MDDLLIFSFNFFVLILVVIVVFVELSSILSFVFLKSGQENNYVTRVQNSASRMYYVFFYVCIAFIGYLYFLSTIDSIYYIALVALAFGFFVNIWLYQVCVINDEGIGAVKMNYSAEIKWSSISTYVWKKNMLVIHRKNGLFRRRKIKFFDTSVIDVVKHHLDDKVPIHTEVKS